MNLPELKEIFGERLSTSDSVRKHHSSDESWHIPENLPDAVIFPNNSEEVSLIIKFANDKDQLFLLEQELHSKDKFMRLMVVLLLTQ